MGVGKVEKRLRMGGKVLRVGWIVCSEENASGSERGGGFSGDLGARILGIDLEYRAVHLHASGGPERVIRSRIAYLRLKHALGRMSLHNPIGAPSNYIE